jgi:hypothetical protein
MVGSGGNERRVTGFDVVGDAVDVGDGRTCDDEDTLVTVVEVLGDGRARPKLGDAVEEILRADLL